MEVLLNKAENVLADEHPGLVHGYKYLKDEVKDQKDENELLQKEMFNLRKESTDLNYKVQAAASKLDILETQLENYTPKKK
jgi:septal ring factor EnvC (AmiA/AmiB activator)